MELLRYVPYLKNEKLRVQCFLIGLPWSCQYIMEFDKPTNLEETIQKDKCFYDRSKHKQEPSQYWKRKDKSRFQKNGFNSFSYKNSRKGVQFGHLSRSVHQQNFPYQSGNNPTERVRGRAEEPKKGPLQCRGCGELHPLRDFP